MAAVGVFVWDGKSAWKLKEETALSLKEIPPPPAAGRVARAVQPYTADRAVNPLADELRSDPPLYPFVLRAKQRPDLGGNLYAEVFSRQCILFVQRQSKNGNVRAIPYFASESTLHAARRQAALDNLTRSCEGFSPEMHYEMVSLASVNGRKSSDTLISLRDQLRSESQEERLIGLERLLATPDPIVFRYFPELLFEKDSSGQIFFDGKWHVNREAAAIVRAVEDIACELGYSCGPNSFEQRLACYQGFCDQSPMGEVERSIYESARISLRLAITHRDPSVFMRRP